MPTYEYRCKSCGHGLEVVQSFTDEPLTKCPSCKKKQLKKVFGSIGITFKGSGFYKTDSKGGSSSAAATAESKSESKSESSGDAAKKDSGKDSSKDSGKNASGSTAGTASSSSTG
ncbi:MAG TPA: zinc ribbon domain-containing protein [Acidimicrobiales bacterium]|nr:zinc ribbon domain-containing protein [Acidimicrobiales bacterium]